ncbi:MULTISPECIES: hypothetical protein [Flavobacterium]|uniref:Lipoprotein n=1 Tax=Flavobacterium hankyongi TaxID=1176532 RepID=A0ABP8ZQF9_9FLAO|nr:hypothetical protein [Flavobacterium sp. N1846]
MKKLLFFALAIVTFGCSKDDYTEVHYEYVPVNSVQLPSEFKKDSIYELPFTYVRPSTCHFFNGFYYDKKSNVRTVAVINGVFEQDNCTAATVNPITEILKFKPTTEDSYIFKIWKGEDSNGNDVYEETEIPVVP